MNDFDEKIHCILTMGWQVRSVDVKWEVTMEKYMAEGGKSMIDIYEYRRVELDDD